MDQSTPSGETKCKKSITFQYPPHIGKPRHIDFDFDGDSDPDYYDNNDKDTTTTTTTTKGRKDRRKERGKVIGGIYYFGHFGQGELFEIKVLRKF